MADTLPNHAEPSTKREAHDLAVEALDEIENGDKEEGEFLAEEARLLDPEEADAVLGADHKEHGK